MRADKNIQQIGDRFEVIVTRNGVQHVIPGRFTSLAAAQEARDLLIASLGRKASGRPKKEHGVVNAEFRRRVAAQLAAALTDPPENRIGYLVRCLRKFKQHGFTVEDIVRPPAHWDHATFTLSRLLLNEVQRKVSEEGVH